MSRYLWQTLIFILHVPRLSYAVTTTCQVISLENTNVSAYSESQTDTVAVLSSIGPQRCAKECRRRTDCGDILYNRDTLTCVLRATVNTDGPWNDVQTNLEPCTNHTCAPSEQCVELKSGQSTCLSTVRIPVVRLVNGDTPHRGRVEIFHSSEWGTISNSGWDDNDAAVVCRELGFSHGFAVASGAYGVGEDSSPVWLSDVACGGTEQRLEDCASSGWSVDGNGEHDNDVGVVCVDQYYYNASAEWSVRLVGGATELQGRVEVYLHGLWSIICHQSTWGYKEAQVVCRQLGYTEGTPMFEVVQGSAPVLIERLDCDGDEAYLVSCTRRYDHSDSLKCHTGVLCTGQVTNATMEGEIRLVGGQNATEGRVEVYHAGHWGIIWERNHPWSDDNARVVCTQLGYSGGYPVYGSFFGLGSEPVWMSQVECTGGEGRLDNCAFGGWGVQSCYRQYNTGWKGIGVVCGDVGTDAYGDIRLENGSVLPNGSVPYEGRVEIYGPTGFGTIRSTNFGDDEAGVVCRQLGFSGYSSYYSSTQFGPGTGTVWISITYCQGDEARLDHCIFDGWDRSAASHSDDVGVTCIP